MGINFSKKSTGDDVEKGNKDTTATKGGKVEKATKLPAAPAKAKLNDAKRPAQHPDGYKYHNAYEYFGDSEPSKYQDDSRGTCDCGAPVPYKGMTCAEQGKTCY